MKAGLRRGLVAALLAVIAASAPATELVGRVVAVADGDTITILDGDRKQHRVRLDGIDAPERAQPFGDRSRQNLRELAHGRDAVAHCPKVDKYGRLVCRVTVDGADVGLELIRRGLAWHFVRYAHEQTEADRRAYAAVEVEAREFQRGLWRDAAPISPWDWRDSHRAAAGR